MIKITVLAVGKLKEKYFLDACSEYGKRLSRFCKIETIEIEPSKITDNPSDAEISNCIEDEGRKILQKISSDGFVTALCIEGKLCDSETLSKNITTRAARGQGHLYYIIGGSYGLSDAVKKRADEKLSMSPMTFPHKLARVMLFEQLYRAFMIENGGVYHK